MTQANVIKSPEMVVRGFVEQVRSGKRPDLAKDYLAPVVLAHQVISGEKHTIKRTPDSYTEHIHEFLECYGQYDLVIEELIAQDNRVYVRWRQKGQHRAPILNFPPTGLPLTSVGSAVYHVNGGKITEYWIQQENEGLNAQLEQNAKVANFG